jgi:hypothetical protein
MSDDVAPVDLSALLRTHGHETVTWADLESVADTLIDIMKKAVAGRDAKEAHAALQAEAYRAVISRSTHVQQLAEQTARLVQAERQITELSGRILELEAQQAAAHVEQ